MPTYSFKDKNTEEEFTLFMNISELDQYKLDNPHLSQLVNGAPMLICPIKLGVTKPSSEFRERVKDIKKSHYGSTIETTHN